MFRVIVFEESIDGRVMKFKLVIAVFGLGLAVIPMCAHHSVEGQKANTRPARWLRSKA
jgi:hypothetical protein